MTSRDRNARASFETLNRPEPPDPEFATRLRARVLAGAGPELRSARVVSFQEPGSGAAPRKRTRWLDIAAVAALLIGLISSSASLAPSTGDNATPAIHAPETGQPVMVGGSAAQDYQYPGPAPVSTEYELHRELDVSDRSIWPALAYGDLVYVIATANTDQIETTVEAIDLETGEVVWRQSTQLSAGMAVTPRGVVAFVPAIDAGTPVSDQGASFPDLGPVRVVLLDLRTGEPIWFSEEVYQGQAGAGLHPIISADSIYFADGNGVIAALALSTGAERWRHAYERTLAAGLDPQICLEGDGVGCIERSIYSVNVAVSDALVYFSDMVTAHVTALAIAGGAERWSVSTIDRAGARTNHGALIAHEDGVIVQLFKPETDPTEGSRYLGLWGAEDGAEVWSGNQVISSIASDGAALFVTYAWREGVCCFLSGVDSRTGKFLWTKQFETEVYLVGYLPAGKTVILQLGYPATTVGIDVETREEVWRFRSSQTDCWPHLPFAADGTLVCWGPGGGLNLYRPIAPAATPTNAYTIGSYVEVTIDNVRLRSEPLLAPDNIIVAAYGEGELFEIVGGPTADADGVVWYKVRNLNSELHGYIVADFVAPAGGR